MDTLLEAFRALNEADTEDLNESLKEEKEDKIITSKEYEDLNGKIQAFAKDYSKDHSPLDAVKEIENKFNIKSVSSGAGFGVFDAEFRINTLLEESELNDYLGVSSIDELKSSEIDYEIKNVSSKKYIEVPLEINIEIKLDESLNENKESGIDEKIDLSTIHKDANAAIESGTLTDATGETLFKIGDLVSTGPHVSKGPYDFRNIKGTIDDVASFEGKTIYHIKALKSQKELPYFEEDELIKVEE